VHSTEDRVYSPVPSIDQEQPEVEDIVSDPLLHLEHFDDSDSSIPPPTSKSEEETKEHHISELYYYELEL
jgi:hypothetical protein